MALVPLREWLGIDGGIISSLIQQAIPDAGRDCAMKSNSTTPCPPQSEIETAGRPLDNRARTMPVRRETGYQCGSVAIACDLPPRGDLLSARSPVSTFRAPPHFGRPPHATAIVMRVKRRVNFVGVNSIRYSAWERPFSSRLRSSLRSRRGCEMWGIGQASSRIGPSRSMLHFLRCKNRSKG